MRDKRVPLGLVCFIGFISAILLTPVFAQEAEKNGKRDSIAALPLSKAEKDYHYAAKEISDLHFFPIEKARWNGYEIRADEWNQLSIFLKKRFLQDARTEIEVHENSIILFNDINRLVKAMDESLKELQAEPKLKDMPVMKFFYIMLLQNNAIKKAWTLANLPKTK